jgi:Protein of unknown function (DUF3352)
MKKGLVIGLVVLLAAGGIAFAAMRIWAGAVSDEAVDLVPADASLYFNAFLNPSRTQKRALRDLLEKFDKAPTPDEATDALADVINQALADTGLTFQDDIDPWLGRQVAVFATDVSDDTPTAAALVATENVDGTKKMIDKLDESEGENPEHKTYEGVDYDLYPEDANNDRVASGFVKNFWVIGSESGFEAVVDASTGDSLGESDRYDDATGVVSDDHLALFYVDPQQILEQASASGEVSPEEIDALEAFPGINLSEPTAGILYARADGLVLEVASRNTDTNSALIENLDESGLLPELPAESWLAIGTSEVGQVASELLQVVDEQQPGTLENIDAQLTAQTGLSLQDDILEWMGDAGLFVEGTGLVTLDGGIVIESKDPQQSEATIETLGRLAQDQGAPVSPVDIGGLSGFAISNPPELPQPINIVAGGDRVVIAYGDNATEQAIDASETLAGSEAFERAADALGDDFNPSFYLEVPAVVTLIEGFLPVDDPTYQEDVKPWIDPLTHIVAGSKLQGDTLVQRVVIGAE